MAFPVPSYPLKGNMWIVGTTPAGGAATQTNIPFMLYVSGHAMELAPSIGNTSYHLTTIIRVPPGTRTWNRGDIVMPDNTVALYYYVLYKEFFYKGTPQAYEGLLVMQCNANATIPRTY